MPFRTASGSATCFESAALQCEGLTGTRRKKTSTWDGHHDYQADKSARAKFIESTPEAAAYGKDETEGAKGDPAGTPDSVSKKKRKKPPHPMLPLGTIVAIEAWISKLNERTSTMLRS